MVALLEPAPLPGELTSVDAIVQRIQQVSLVRRPSYMRPLGGMKALADADMRETYRRVLGLVLGQEPSPLQLSTHLLLATRKIQPQEISLYQIHAWQEFLQLCNQKTKFCDPKRLSQTLAIMRVKYERHAFGIRPSDSLRRGRDDSLLQLPPILRPLEPTR